MKKTLLISFIIILNGIVAFGQTTATDFTLTDCSGNSHHLFSELDAGKVIVISFVMPCASCIGPSVSAYNSVQNYSISDPGRVFFYLADDNGTTSCSTLNSWASQNGMPTATVISTTALLMSQYSGNGLGMPKIVVLGGSGHTVFYNENNGANSHDLEAAINLALLSTELKETENEFLNLSVFPNPVKNQATVTYSLKNVQEVTVDIVNILGEKIQTIALAKQTAGNYSVQINTETLSNGVYFVKLNSGDSLVMQKFTVSH